MLMDLMLFCYSNAYAQQYKVRSFIEYYPKWVGKSELLNFSKEDFVLIINADFTSIIKGGIIGDTLIFDFPYNDTTNIFLLVKYNDLYFHTQKMTISEKYLQHDDNILYFIWVDINDDEIEADSKSEWNHYFTVVFDRMSARGDPAMAEPYFIINKKKYFKEGKDIFLKAMLNYYATQKSDSRNGN